MKDGTKVIFSYTVAGVSQYITGTFKEVLPNGKYLIESTDGSEFELDQSEVSEQKEQNN